LHDTEVSPPSPGRRTACAALIALLAAAGVGAEERAAGAGPGGETASRRERDEFVSGAEKELAAARQRLDQMKHDVAHASGKARTDLQNAVHTLERQQRVVRAKLSRLKSATLEKWTSLKEGVESDLGKLRQSLHKHDADKT